MLHPQLRLTAGSVLTVALASGSPIASAQQSGTLEEVVVTARKRTETLQDVPMAVSALSASQLERSGVADVTGLEARVPGLTFTTGGGAAPSSDFTYVVLRGVGFNGGLEPATGIFIDGMYQPQLGFDTRFLDLERVEVLRGPQGTLFGRNTQAGAINLVTRQPGPQTAGKLEAEIAEFSSYRLHAALSGPLADEFFAGASAEYAESDGYTPNVTSGRDGSFSEQLTGRVNLRWQPGDALAFALIADVSQRDYNDIGFGVPLACDCYDLLNDQDRDDEKNSWGIQLNADWKLDDSITLTSLTGYREVDSDILLDDDGHVTNQAARTLRAVTQSTSQPIVPISVAPQPITVAGTAQAVGLDQEFLSQELRLAAQTQQLDWLIGAYYFDQRQEQFRSRDIGPGVGLPFGSLYIRELFTEDRDGWALFGQASYRFVDAWELTVGGRHSDESVEVGGDRVLNVSDAAIFAFPKLGRTKYDDFSTMASISYQFLAAATVYFTYAEGWKAGGLNRFPSRDNAIVPYDAETSANLELGLKATWLEGRLTTNLALFDIEIEDQQLLVTIPDPAGVTPITAITNAARSSSQGVELDVQALVADALIFGLAYSYNDAKFDDFIQTGTGTAKDRSGEQFEYVPEQTASASLTYTIPFGSDTKLELFANYRYVEEYAVPEVSLVSPLGAQLQVPSYDRIDLRATFKYGDWSVGAYVDNVADSLDYNNLFVEQYRGAPGGFFVSPLPPRQFGVVLSRSL